MVDVNSEEFDNLLSNLKSSPFVMNDYEYFEIIEMLKDYKELKNNGVCCCKFAQKNVIDKTTLERLRKRNARRCHELNADATKIQYYDAGKQIRTYIYDR